MEAFWTCRHTWGASAYNTMWCLIGCAIGDLGTIAFFQFAGIAWPVLAIMALAMVNGLATSVLLETTAVALALAAGFVTPWPYNYWRLKKYGQACH